MSLGAIRARDYLAHMLEAVNQIQAYTLHKSAEDFAADRLLQDAVVRNVEILGEASRRLMEALPDAISRFSGIPFAAICAMRNQLSHGYFTVDLDIVWKVVERDIPELRIQIEGAISQLDTGKVP